MLEAESGSWRCGKTNLVVSADEVDDVAWRVGEHPDSAAVDECRQRAVDVDLTLWNGKHHVDALLGDLLRQLAYRRVVLQSFSYFLSVSTVERWYNGHSWTSNSGVARTLAAWCGGQICHRIVLGFGKWIACLKPRVLMPKVTCSIYSILSI